MLNILPSDRVPILAAIDPDVLTAAAHTSDYVDMSKVGNIMAIAMAGTLGSSATFDAKLVQATDASGTDVKDISGKAITQLTQAGTDSDKQAIINCRPDDLDTANGFNHVALVITVGTASSDGAGLILGMDAGYEPATDLASVDEIVE